MFTALMEAIVWVVVTAMFLASKTLDWNTVYIAWTILVATIAIISVIREKK